MKQLTAVNIANECLWLAARDGAYEPGQTICNLDDGDLALPLDEFGQKHLLRALAQVGGEPQRTFPSDGGSWARAWDVETGVASMVGLDAGRLSVSFWRL